MTTETQGQAETTSGAATQDAGAQGAAAGTTTAKADEGKGTQADSKAGAVAEGGAVAEPELKLPEGVQVNKELLEGFKAFAKEAGVGPKYSQKFVDTYFKMAAAQEEASKKAFTALVATNAETVKKAWGTDHEKNVNLSNKALTLIGASPEVAKFANPEQVKTFIAETGLGTHPIFLGLMHAIGRMSAEDNINRGGTSGGDAPPTREQITRETFPNSPEMWTK